MSAYLLGAERLGADGAGFRAALANAHVKHQRPLCLCQQEGVGMYVARLGGTFIVKRMPGTGSLHAPHCSSYEPPTEPTGPRRHSEQIAPPPPTDSTPLKLDFAMSRIDARSPSSVRAGDLDSRTKCNQGLTLGGLLPYLWDQAELTRWHPSFSGRRSWSTVRRRLLAVAHEETACGRPLSSHLFIPEVFRANQRSEIAARRRERWSGATRSVLGRLRFMLLIGELKWLGPSECGHAALIKHLPDQLFVIEGTLYGQICRRFGDELSVWDSHSSLHLIVIATFSISTNGVPTIEELSLMLTTLQWLPTVAQLDAKTPEPRDGSGDRRCFK